MINKFSLRTFAVTAIAVLGCVAGASSASASPRIDSPTVVSITPFANDATSDSTPTLTFVATDSDGIDTIECGFDGAPLAPCTSPITAPPPLADGSHYLSITVTDMNAVSTPFAYGFMVDTIAPALTITAPLAGDVVTTSMPDVSFALDNGTATCSFDGGPFTTCVSPFIAAALPNGQHTLTVHATDLAGNTTDRSVAFSVNDPDQDSPGDSSISGTGGKLKNGKFTATIKVGFELPSGVKAAEACKGTATLKIKPKAKKAKSYKKKIKLKRSGSKCVVKGSFRLPAKYKGKKLSTTLTFKGNSVLGKFTLRGTTKKV
jgi:hypothetical protein